MSLSFNPQELPVIGIDDHLPSVAERAIAARRRCGVASCSRRPGQPEIVVERRFIEREPAHASVLVPLVQRDELTVLLTQRTDHLSDHPGQISFPGGRAEPEDPDATATALREAQEEIGLAPRTSTCWARLPTYTTGTGFIVTPVVALVRPGFETAGRPVRGGRGVRGAARVPDEPGPPPTPCGRVRRRAARVPVDAVAGFRQRRSAAALLRLGRHGSHAAQPVPLPRRWPDACERGQPRSEPRRYHRRP